MSQRQSQAGDTGETCGDPHPPAPMPIDERRPEPLETPGQGELVEMADFDEAGAMDPQVDRHCLVDQAKGKARRKGNQRDPAEAGSKWCRNGRWLSGGGERQVQRHTASSNINTPSRMAMRPRFRSRSRERVLSFASGAAPGPAEGSVVLVLLGGR